MKKTKTIILAMSAALCLALSGCGGYTTVTADPSEVSEKKSDEQAKAASEEKAKDTAKAEEAAVSKKTAEEESTPSTAAEPAETEKKKKKKKSTRSSITNEKVSSKIEKQRPIAVMYPINYEAQPQYGLNKVDVFYEMIEEGDMSRQMGIIQDWHDLSLIGNIRSTRSYFVLEAMRYDAIMLHFGGPIDWLIDVTSREDLDNLNGVGGVLGGDYGAYFRIDNGKAMEHTAFTNAESVKNACAAAGEIVLTGEVLSASHLRARLKESRSLGFHQILVPQRQAKSVPADEKSGILGVENVSQALNVAFA